jgi:NADH dehydrogenase FAD-containing subunit
MDTKDQGRSAIGGTSSLGSGQQTGNITYGVMPEQITNKLKENPGAEFIVIQRVRQGEDPQVWASGDAAQTRPVPARLHVAGVQGAGAST